MKVQAVLTKKERKKRAGEWVSTDETSQVSSVLLSAETYAERGQCYARSLPTRLNKTLSVCVSSIDRNKHVQITNAAISIRKYVGQATQALAALIGLLFPLLFTETHLRKGSELNAVFW